MNALVVDASVALKWLVKEADSYEAEAVVESGATLHAPGFLLVETINAAWKNWRKEIVDAETVRKAGERLTSLIDIWHADQGLMREAADLAIELQHPVFDCIYLALARELGERVVTVDKRLLAVAPRGTAISLADWLSELPPSVTPPPPVSP